MTTDEINDGKVFANRLKPIIFDLLKNHEWVTYSDIANLYEEKYPNPDYKNQDYYKSATHVMDELRCNLQKKGHALKEEGENRNKRFRLPEEVSLDSEIKEYETKRKRMRQKQLLRLIASSDGLFPSSWMADFKEDINKMMQEESKTFRKIIGFDTNQMLDHLEDIADFYTAIENKQVLKIVYNAAYLKKKTITIVPHFIKEYNYRWFLLGKGMDEDGKVRESYVCAIDRIESYEQVDDSYSECNIDYTKYSIKKKVRKSLNQKLIMFSFTFNMFNDIIVK